MKAQAIADPPSRGNSQQSAWNLVFGGWLVATAATLGALFFSEIMKLPPCVLCWYQRIFMFPLVILLPFGLFPFDPRIVRYALPLSAIGGSIAVFHVLITYGLIPERIQPCTQGVPCAQNPIEWFGFLSIPLLSLGAFSIISALLILAHRKVQK
ncbi:MAG: disulfide bond formation protein B [Gemmatimonadota bacterium]